MCIIIYPYRCPKCGAEQDVWQTLSEYCDSPRIPDHCDGKMVRVFTVPMVAPDYVPFVSHVDGSVINSRSGHREHMARHGLVLHDDVQADLPAKRKAVTEAHFATLKEDIHEAVAMVQQGYKPQQAVAKVTGDSPSDWSESGIDITSSLPNKECVQSLGA